jgi:hypothetical protein
MSARRVALALLAALTLLLASCGGDDDGGAASAPSGETGSNDGASGDDGSDDDGSTGGGSSGGDLDLCSLFTEEEAEALFDGVDLSPDPNADDELSCVYDGSRSTPPAFAIVQIHYQPDALKGTSLEEVAGLLAGVGGDEGLQLEEIGLGDGVVAVRGLIPMVMIEHDESVVTVAVTGTDDDESATSDVAAVVVDRLR